MTIRHWMDGEGPRDKLLQRGAESLSDAELLAVLLNTGTRNMSAVDLGRQLLVQFGGLTGVLQADAASLQACPGVGAAKYASLRASLELARRQAMAELELPVWKVRTKYLNLWSPRRGILSSMSGL